MNQLEIISAAIESEYAAQLIARQHKPAASIAGTDATLRVDSYIGPNGSGFAVVVNLPAGSKSLTFCKQSGPEAYRERPVITQEGFDQIRLASIPDLSPRQFKEWLIREGKREMLIAAIQTVADPTEKAIMQNWYDEASVFQRSYALTDQLCPVLGLSARQLDLAFIAASKL